jgi:hypothetical protein
MAVTVQSVIDRAQTVLQDTTGVRYPRNFYVYPGVNGAAYLEIIYSSNPAAVAQVDNLSIPDIFANAVLNYVLYMAYMKDAEYAGNQQRASSHFQLFTASITGKGQIDAITNPNMERRAPQQLAMA